MAKWAKKHGVKTRLMNGAATQKRSICFLSRPLIYVSENSTAPPSHTIPPSRHRSRPGPSSQGTSIHDDLHDSFVTLGCAAVTGRVTGRDRV